MSEFKHPIKQFQVRKNMMRPNNIKYLYQQQKDYNKQKAMQIKNTKNTNIFKESLGRQPIVTQNLIKSSKVYKILQDQIKLMTIKHTQQLTKLKEKEIIITKQTQKINKNSFNIKLEIWELKNQIMELKNQIPYEQEQYEYLMNENEYYNNNNQEQEGQQNDRNQNPEYKNENEQNKSENIKNEGEQQMII